MSVAGAPDTPPARGATAGAWLARLRRPLRSLLIPLIGWALSMSMARSLGADVDWWGVLACVAGVHAAYRFDSLADDVGFRGMLGDPRLLIVAADGALLAWAALESPRLLPPLLVLSLAGLLYVPLKRWIPKNILTAGAWSGAVFGLSLRGLAMTSDAWLALAALFLTIAANANLCDLQDVEHDRRNGVRGFATWLGARGAARVAAGMALAGFALAAVSAPPLCVPAALFAILGVWFPPLLLEHRPVRVWLDALLVLPGPVSLLLAFAGG